MNMKTGNLIFTPILCTSIMQPSPYFYIFLNIISRTHSLTIKTLKLLLVFNRQEIKGSCHGEKK